MKIKLITILTVLLICTTTVYAGWVDTFIRTYKDKGIDDAVVVSLKEGISPYLIMSEGVKIGTLTHTNLIKALYCAGVKGIDIKESAKKLDISDFEVVVGYKRSIAECDTLSSDSQGYTPIGTTGFVSVNIGGGGRNVSPSTFE